MKTRHLLACLLLCISLVYSYNLHEVRRGTHRGILCTYHQCQGCDNDSDNAGSDSRTEHSKIDLIDNSNSDKKSDNENIKKALKEKIDLEKFESEMDTYRDESKVYLDEEKNTEEIVFSWSDIDLEKEAIISYLQGEVSSPKSDNSL